MASNGTWKKNDLQRTKLGQAVARASPKKVNRLDLMGTFLDRVIYTWTAVNLISWKHAGNLSESRSIIVPKNRLLDNPFITV